MLVRDGAQMHESHTEWVRVGIQMLIGKVMQMDNFSNTSHNVKVAIFWFCTGQAKWRERYLPTSVTVVRSQIREGREVQRGRCWMTVRQSVRQRQSQTLKDNNNNQLSTRGSGLTGTAHHLHYAFSYSTSRSLPSTDDVEYTFFIYVLGVI